MPGARQKGASQPMEHNAHFATCDQAAGWFDKRRWYGDKGREIRDLKSTFRADASIAGRDVQIELVRIEFLAGQSSTYHLVHDAGDFAHDGIEDESVRSWLMNGFHIGRVLNGSTGQLRWTGSEELLAQGEGATAESRVFRGEQSNTSVVFDDQVMLKLFRKVQRGRNPEVEIGKHLTLNTGFTAFPRLLGTIDLVETVENSTIACVQQFISSKGDAWTWMLDRLDDAAFAREAIQSMHVLGRRTAELHTALALGTDPAFAPEPIDSAFAGSLLETMVQELDETILQLEYHGSSGVGDLRGVLAQTLEALRLLDGTHRTRIHGDFHLGQVLRTEQDDFAILDFEGEPTRSIEERREKASPLRDVAGMLRSIEYLAEAARRRAPAATPDGYTFWRESARTAFTDGYTTAVGASPTLAQGFDPGSWERIVAAFEVYKALYEVRYELGNRPDWVDIPLRGLRRLAVNSG